MGLELIKAGRVVADILTHDETVKSYVNSRIYPVFEKRGTTYPYVIFSRGDIVQQGTKDYRPYSSSCYVNIYVYSEDYGNAIDIACAVYDALIHRQGTYNGIRISDVRFVSMDEAYTTTANDIYVESMTFLITE